MRALASAAVAAAAAATTFYLARGKKAATKKTFTLGYWHIRGLAAPCRMLLHYANITFRDETFEVHKKQDQTWDRSAWFGSRKPELKKMQPLINLPYLIDHSNSLVLSQTNAILMYLARLSGLDGRNDIEAGQIDMVLAQTMDLRNIVTNMAYGSQGDVFRENLTKHLQTVGENSYGKLAAFLGNSQYFVGDRVTVADFHAWEMIDQHELMAAKYGFASPMAAFPAMAAFHQRMRDLPELASYFESSSSTLPVNNKMAAFT